MGGAIQRDREPATGLRLCQISGDFQERGRGMRSRSAVALCAGMLMGGCLGRRNPECAAPDGQPGSIRIVQGAPYREAGEGMGSLVIRATRVRDQTAGLQKVIVSLHADPRVSNPDESLRRSGMDGAGIVRWDSIPAGTYGVFARAIGHDGLRGRIVVRAGHVDTVQAALRGRTRCAAPNSGGVPPPRTGLLEWGPSDHPEINAGS